MTRHTMQLVATAAHACWCERMSREGWHPGAYSREARTHDALIEFGELGKADQRRTLRAVRFEGVADQLADLVDYIREGVPELQVEDMRAGRRVRSVVDFDDPEPDEDARFGRVVSWTVGPSSGDLELVRVQWDDGATSEHTPNERDIMLTDAPASRSEQ